MPDEFGLIAHLFAPLAARFPGALGLTDDAALVDCPPDHHLAMTTDALVAGVHFLPDDPPDLIARKAVRVNISDLAAMGATPMAILLAACFPQTVDDAWLQSFAHGLSLDLREFGIALIGGDTVATPGPLTLSLTALGTVETGRELRRSTARAGDVVWTSGTLGDAALGLYVLKGHSVPNDAATFLVDRYRLPRPRTALGQALAGLAHACMDISDGLLGDLKHICDASHVGAIIEAGNVPLSAAAQTALSYGVGNGLSSILCEGDDYELLFTAPPAASDALKHLSDRQGLRLSEIGRIISGTDVTVIGTDGRTLSFVDSGYKHFAI